ncbi:NUDIX hydrolase domain-like protein [Pilaira anomala]|nr:NUDIX hydrolase domain-like protein [Pilaira anomala]
MLRRTLKKPLTPIKNSPSTFMGAGGWLQLECVQYKDNKGIERKWERCIRKKEKPSNVDAVDIHAILITPEEPEILLVVQYRPAVEHYCIEFPSGLIDPDENDPIKAAQRELKEETGYSVSEKDFQLLNVPVAYEPGLTSSCCYVVKATIDVRESTELPVQQLEPDEWSLQTISLPLNGLLSYLIEQTYKGRLIIDSRLHAFAAGIAYSGEFL